MPSEDLTATKLQNRESTEALLDEFRETFAASSDFSAREFLAKHPDAKSKPPLAVEIIFEEYWLRMQNGESIDSSEFADRYPEWRSKIAVTLACDDVLRYELPLEFPLPGETISDFTLHSELGRGAKGRVFLATQPSLSDRPVVLKLSARSGSEHLSLARLQHTSIVPLLFSQDDAQRETRLLAMPYLGGCTLDDAMHALSDIPAPERSGKDVADAIRSSADEAPAIDWDQRIDRPALRFLSSATYEQAVCWIAACLADGLHYAHQRGVVHLDVKPSNVLLAGDGQPMLLDFHLAKDVRTLEAGNIRELGGTPGYMAPEQVEAFHRLQEASGPEAATVDHRCDLYSLGLLLRDCLSGALPPMVETVEESPRRLASVANLSSETLSPRTSRLIKRCLSVDPCDRPTDAAEMARELRQIAVGLEPVHGKRLGLIGFAAGCLVTLAFVGIVNKFQEADTPPQVTQPPAINAVSNELHNLVTQSRAAGVLESGSPEEKLALLNAAERLLSQQQVLLDSIDAKTHPASAMRLSNDLSDLRTLRDKLQQQLVHRGKH